MKRRSWGSLAALALLASGLVSTAVSAPTEAATTPVHALVAVPRTVLLNTATGVGVVKGPMKPHRWVNFRVPSGVLTQPGRQMVLTLNITSPTASGRLGLVSTRSAAIPASALSYAARTATGTTVLRAASSTRTLSLYNNSAGKVQVVVAAIGYTQPSPTEAFHAASRVILKKSAPPGAWLPATAVGDSIPTNATAVLARLTMTGTGRSGGLTVASTLPTTALRPWQYSYSPYGASANAAIRTLGRGGKLYFYNGGTRPVGLLVTAIGYVTPTAARVIGARATSTTQGQVSLSWINPPNTSSVIVRRSSTATPPATPTAGTAVPLTSLTTAIDTTGNGLQPGLATYSIFAQSGTATSDPTTIVRPGPPVPAPTPSPGYPVGPGCMPSPGEVLYSWNQTGTVDHYIVSLSSAGGGVMIPSPGSPPQGIRLPGTARSYPGTGLEGRGEYGLTIYALDAVGNYLSDLYIDCIAGDGTDQAPGAVSAVTSTATPSSVTLNWRNAPQHVVNGATCDGYVAISRAEGNAGPSTPQSTTVIQAQSDYQATSLTDPTVLPGHTYTYSIWSMTCSGGYGTAVSSTVTTPTGNTPTAVAGLTAVPLPPSPTNSGQSIRLQWNAPATQPAGYLIARSIGTGATPPANIYVNGAWRLSGPTTAYTDSGLAASTKVAYSIWAIGADGSYSPVATTTATTDPNLPRTVTGHITNSSTHAVIAQSTSIAFTSDAGTVNAAVSANGTYAVQLPVGVYQACVSDDGLSDGAPYGYFRTCAPLTVAANTSTFDLPVDPKGAVTGTITDPSTGQPVAGASVSMPDPSRNEVGGFHPYLIAKTAADGTYALIGARGGTAPTISVTSPVLNGTSSYTPSSTNTVAPNVPAGQSVVQNFSMTKLPTITISGTVTSAASGVPVSGLTVYIGHASGTSFSIVTSTTTAANGTYSEQLAVQPSDNFQVCVDAETSHSGFTNRCFGGGDFDRTATPPYAVYGTATAISYTQTANLPLQPLSTITGKVVGPTGVAIQGATVTPWMADRADGSRFATTTDAQGNYTIHTPLAADMTNLQPKVCPNATTVVDAVGPGGYLGSSTNCSNTVNVSPVTPTSSAVNLNVAFAAGVSGIVTDPTTGTPLAGVHVNLDDKVTQQYDTYPSYQAVTDASGRYLFSGLDPSGTNLTVSFDAYTGSTGIKYASQTYQNTSPSTLTLTAGQATAANMPLARAATLAGTVTDSTTNLPLAGVTVTSAGNGIGVTDSSGHYIITGVAPTNNANASVGAVVTGPGTGYQPGTASGIASAGTTTTLDIGLQPAAELDVRVVAPDGRPLSGVALSFWSAASFTPPSGTGGVTDSTGYLHYRGIIPFVTPLGTLCAHSGNPGPGSTAGFTWGCTPMKPLAAGKVSTVVIVLGYDGHVGASVYDKSTGQPISGATVSFYVPGGTPGSPATTGSTVNGFTFGNNGVPMMQSGGALPNAMNSPQYRVCAQAPGYAPACADDDASDGSSGTVFSPYPGVTTVAAIGLTPN